LLDKQGKTILKTEYGKLEKYKNGYIGVTDRDSELKGCLDPGGNIAVPCKYNRFEGFTDDSAELALVRTGRLFQPAMKCGFVDKKGVEVIPLVYNDAKSFDGGYAEICQNYKWGLIDASGNAVIPLKYPMIDKYQDLVRFVIEAINSEYGLEGVMDLKGNIILPVEYDRVYLAGDGMIGALKNRKTGLFNAGGSALLPIIYDFLGYFWDNTELIGAEIDGKAGYIEKTGNIAIPFLFEKVREFNFGRAPVLLDGKWGMTDTKGNMVIPAEYDGIYAVYEELTVAEKNGERVMLEGTMPILPLSERDGMRKFNKDGTWFKINGLWYLLRKEKNG
jgi:hypothetical protein